MLITFPFVDVLWCGRLLPWGRHIECRFICT